MSDELITIAEFELLFEAEMAKNCLEDNGIKATVVGEDLTIVSPAVGKTWIEVQVLDADADNARAVLEEHKARCQDAAENQAEGNCDCDCSTDCSNDGECDINCDCNCDCGEDE